jgi:hypothetical protein
MVVSFAKSRKVKVYAKVRDSEVNRVWWSASDYQSFRRTCIEALIREEKGSNLKHSNNYCTRGLEDWPLQKCIDRKQRISDAIQTVLDEQKRVREEEGVVDPVAIAEKYQEVCAPALEISLMKGWKDEEEAVQQALEARRKSNLNPGKRQLSIDGREVEMLREVEKLRREHHNSQKSEDS